MKNERLSILSWLITISAIVACLPSIATADTSLLGLGPDFPLDRITSSDAKVTITNTANAPCLHVVTGHEQKWPGATIPAPKGTWDVSAHGYILMQVKNTGAKSATICLRIDNAGADGTRNCLNGSANIDPGATGTIRVGLTRTTNDKLGGKLFGMRGYPVKTGGEGAIDPAQVTQFVVFLNQPREDHAFDIIDIRAEGTYTAPTAWSKDADPFFPFIDQFGQYRHKDWPGKTKSGADLLHKRDLEAKTLSNNPGPKDWNQFGGWTAGPKLPATGFFRVEKYKGKWTLVDPEGRLFWSHGIDCVRMIDSTPMDERESWFADFPGKHADFAEFIIPSAYALHGHYAGKSPKCYSFAAANLKRKYGADWKQVYPPVVHQRLRAWGLNTIANWSDHGVARMRRTPYTDNLSSGGVKMIEGSEGYWGKFPDVFDPGFRERLRQHMATKKGDSAGDPWCLGYFSDNEMSWGDETSLALAALASPPTQAAKQAFINNLKAKYVQIEKLNTVWGQDYTNWDSLLTSTNKPDVQKAGDDLRAFYTCTAEQYFRTVREAIKEIAPNQLYLGCRFAWTCPLAAAAAAKYCDVVSYNLYQRSIADFKSTGAGDVPLLVGEFHFGALDRGMFHTGLVPVNDQATRAQAYRDYVEGALKHPQFVGTHWFQYQDEPTTGRVYDEENYQIGFVDIADTPYPETINASHAVGDALYRIRFGP